MNDNNKEKVEETVFKGFDDTYNDQDFSIDDFDFGDDDDQSKKEDEKNKVVDPTSNTSDEKKQEGEAAKEGEGEKKQEGDGESKKEDSQTSKEPQAQATTTPQQTQQNNNAYFAQMRREQEAKEKAENDLQRQIREKQIRENAKLEAELELYKVNEFSNTPIVDAEDLRIYKIQLEIKKNGGDPSVDLPKKLAEINRLEKQRILEEENAKKKQEEDLQKQVQEDIADFVKEYPSVNLKELYADEYFTKATYDSKGRNRLGKWTLIDIYEESQRLKKNAEEEGKKKAASKAVDEKAKNMNTTLPATANNTTTIDYLSMTDEEYEKLLAKEHENDFF